MITGWVLAFAAGLGIGFLGRPLWLVMLISGITGFAISCAAIAVGLP